VNAKNDIYDINIKHGISLVATEQALGRDFNHALLTFSGGALVVSVTLVSGAFGTSLLECYLPLLFVSWLLFGISILCTISSIQTSQISFQKDLEILYSNIDKVSGRYEGAWVQTTKWLSRIAFGLFAVAMTLLFLFILLNLISAEDELNGCKERIEECCKERNKECCKESCGEGNEESLKKGEHTEEGKRKGTSSSSKTSKQTRQTQEK